MIRFLATNTIIACTCMASRSVLLVIYSWNNEPPVLYNPFIYYCINIGSDIDHHASCFSPIPILVKVSSAADISAEPIIGTLLLVRGPYSYTVTVNKI